LPSSEGMQPKKIERLHQVVAYLLLLVLLEDLGLAYEHQNLSIPNIKI